LVDQQTQDWKKQILTHKSFTTAELDLMTAQGEIILELFEKSATGKLIPSSINPRAVWVDIKLECK
jgi:hypothetical protein